MRHIMTKAKWLLTISLFFVSSTGLQAETDDTSPAFELVVLGDSGGIQDGNLSAFLLRSVSEVSWLLWGTGLRQDPIICLNDCSLRI